MRKYKTAVQTPVKMSSNCKRECSPLPNSVGREAREEGHEELRRRHDFPPVDLQLQLLRARESPGVEVPAVQGLAKRASNARIAAASLCVGILNLFVSML